MKAENYLVVVADSESRSRLVQALAQLCDNCAVRSASSLERAFEYLAEADEFSLIILDREFPPLSVASFLEKSRNLQTAAAAAYILLYNSESFTRQDIAERMIVGVHGFLREPYTSEEVLQAVALAPKVKRQGTLIRMKAAAGVSLQEVLDGARAAQPTGQSGGLWSELENVFERFKHLTGETMTTRMKALRQSPPTLRLEKYLQLRSWLRALIVKDPPNARS